MNLPRGFWDARFSIIQEGAKESVGTYLRDGKYLRGEGLFIWGPYGHGKTGAAAVILMELRRRGHVCLYADSSDLVDKILQREPFDFESSWSERAKAVDVLVLDDLGTEHRDPGGAIEKVLEGILRYRFQRRKVTIITCNVSPMKLGPHVQGTETFKGVYREKFVEILREKLYPVEVRGRSLRDENERQMAAGY